jgi:hypothetical protein
LGPVLLRGLPAHVGVAPRAQTLAQLNLGLSQVHLQRLGVGVGRDELDSFQLSGDHGVNGIAAAAADPHHFQLGHVISRFHQFQHPLSPSASANFSELEQTFLVHSAQCTVHSENIVTLGGSSLHSAFRAPHSALI